MDQEQNIFSKNNDGDQRENASQEHGDHRLVRLIKTITVNPERGKFVDDNIIKFKYYNAFNYSLLARGHENVNLTLGITSPKQGEGKTLVACNLAASFAMGSQKNTVLVDLNIVKPRLHEVFGITQTPGLAEALNNGTIHVSQTAIEHLSVLTAGRFIPHKEGVLHQLQNSQQGQGKTLQPSLGLDQLPAFRDVIYSLEQEFELVIVDMPAINTEGVPVLFANYLNGLLVVINSGKTKQEDLDTMFHHVNEHQVLGFVMNRFKGNPA